MRRADNLTTFMCDCIEIWESKLSGTLWTCTGIALPLFVMEMDCVFFEVGTEFNLLTPSSFFTYHQV